MKSFEFPFWHKGNMWNSYCVKSVRIWSYSGPFFPAFRMSTERCRVSLHVQSEYGKIQTRITSNTDTFHVIIVYRKPSKLDLFRNLCIQNFRKHSKFKKKSNYFNLKKVRISYNEKVVYSNNWGKDWWDKLRKSNKKLWDLVLRNFWVFFVLCFFI